MGNVSVSRAYKRNLPFGSACFTGIWLLLFTGNIWFDSDVFRRLILFDFLKKRKYNYSKRVANKRKSSLPAARIIL